MESYVFENNRKKILDQMEDSSILIEFSRTKKESVFNPKYDINRNYYYLCGLFEYENIVVLTKINNHPTQMIFINPYDEMKAKWVGAPLSKETVTNISGIKDVRYLDTFISTIERLAGAVKNIYLDIEQTNLGSALTEDELFAKSLKEKYPFVNILNGRSLFTHARTIKQKEEIDEMKKAIEITNKGIKSILSNLKPGLYEYQIESYFDQTIKYEGGTGYAFPTIAASGANATCLHYSDNNSIMKDGDLILFDLGSSVNMYCSDISRTFPVNGKFSERQKQLYDIVLNAQQEAFNNMKPGITTRELNQVVIKYYEKALKDIGLIDKPEDVLKYYYHGVSHHIGLDCHDLCDYTPLKAGSIISNEPGLYIKEEGIGIRIEDDVLITENGAEWLSPQIIKTTDDIEKFMKENRK